MYDYNTNWDGGVTLTTGACELTGDCASFELLIKVRVVSIQEEYSEWSIIAATNPPPGPISGLRTTPFMGAVGLTGTTVQK